jgi:hypothetical protein
MARYRIANKPRRKMAFEEKGKQKSMLIYFCFFWLLNNIQYIFNSFFFPSARQKQILTPAFHFKILEDFMEVFNEQSAILVKKMSAELDKDSFNLFPYVTLCTLDIICGMLFRWSHLESPLKVFPDIATMNLSTQFLMDKIYSFHIFLYKFIDLRLLLYDIQCH